MQRWILGAHPGGYTPTCHRPSDPREWVRLCLRRRQVLQHLLEFCRKMRYERRRVYMCILYTSCSFRPSNGAIRLWEESVPCVWNNLFRRLITALFILTGHERNHGRRERKSGGLVGGGCLSVRGKPEGQQGCGSEMRGRDIMPCQSISGIPKAC